MATWSSDDSKVITSQTCVLKLTDVEIIPGSQILYVWDSMNGLCLIGIPSAHQKACPVLASHPLDTSIVMSASLDGFIKVWNIENGNCEFSHFNTHQYGSLENFSDKGKVCGYLDGTFSPDGMNLVLTDDTGRISVLDALGSQRDQEINNVSVHDHAPSWMQEQYFANDYYDLFYDRNGYCIERGSRLPPYIAPGAARCNHIGNAHSDSIQIMFSGLKGPVPITEIEAKTRRDEIRALSVQVRKFGGILTKNVAGKRHLIELRPNAASHVKSVSTLDHNITAQSISSVAVVPRTLGSNRDSPRGTRRNLSINYRWIDFDEAAGNDDESNEDSDDEDFRDGRRLLNTDDEEENENVDDDNDDDVTEEYENQTSIRRRRINALSSRQRAARSRRRRDIVHRNVETVPTRISARQSSRISRGRTNNIGTDDDDDEVEEMLSHNTQPFGEYVKDYTELGHLFKLPRENDDIHRNWALREDCVDGYTGWKTYLPQVGDFVVYIPKLHSETLKHYPVCETTSGAPWKETFWQKNYPWPVVQCRVNNVRYRFPYSEYFGNRSRYVYHFGYLFYTCFNNI